jgi:Big-like domain-containing protein
MPTGGPPDIEPPRLVSSSPDSGAAKVPREGPLSLTFSEGMEPRTTGEAVAISPPVEFRRLRWSGRTVTVELAKPLDSSHAYTLFVGRGAHDRHGNTMEVGATVVFTTGDSMPPGSIEGRLDAKGFAAAGVYLWCYDTARHTAPDSTGRDFDAVGLVDADGRFRIPALAVPRSYRIWAFADQNQNHSFEPERDLLAPVDTTIALTASEPVARDLVFRVVNPHAPAVVRGTVLDSLGEHEGDLYVIATADSDTTRRVLATVSEHRWETQLDPGGWTVRAFRDLDRNRIWTPARESASDPKAVRAEPAGLVEGIELVMRRPGRAP